MTWLSFPCVSFQLHISLNVDLYSEA